MNACRRRPTPESAETQIEKKKQQMKPINQRQRNKRDRERAGRTIKRREERRQQLRNSEVKVSRERKQAEQRLSVERVGNGAWLAMPLVKKRREGTVARAGSKMKQAIPTEWQEDRVRIGTGYRVRRAADREIGGENSNSLVLDLGYGHKRCHKRPEGMEATRRKTNIGRTLSIKAKKARELVIQEICKRERRRPRSVYTGCGRTRKNRVGKKKLKPTKVRAIL
jgi:hypothetical protein